MKKILAMVFCGVASETILVYCRTLSTILDVNGWNRWKEVFQAQDVESDHLPIKDDNLKVNYCSIMSVL